MLAMTAIPPDSAIFRACCRNARKTCGRSTEVKELAGRDPLGMEITEGLYVDLLITLYSLLFTHIPKYRNQISTLLGVPPLNFQIAR